MPAISPPLVAACLWAVAATITALLPMRRQMGPGLTLLILAPVLLIWIGRVHGWVWVLVATLGFVSMFRRPLVHLVRRAIGGRRRT